MSTLQNLNIYLVLTFLTLINGFNVVFAQSRVEQVKHEHQHIADIGNGLYKNPILAGEYADPTVVRVGKDYYMTHTSYTFQPGLLVWHSQDLINCKPIDHAIQEFDGTICSQRITLFASGKGKTIFKNFNMLVWNSILFTQISYQ